MKAISISLEASQVEILKDIAGSKRVTVSQAARSLMESAMWAWVKRGNEPVTKSSNKI